MRRKQRAPRLVSIGINGHIINLYCGTPSPKDAKGDGAHTASFDRRFRRFRDSTGYVHNCSQRPFATFGIGVPQSKLMICLLVIIEMSDGSLCFHPI